MKHISMRRSGLSRCLLGGLLLLCIACLELPEMSALNDDASNDFTILSIASPSSVVAVVAPVADTETEGPSTVSAAAPASSSAFAFTSERALRNPLSLHSLWRT
jgi:hypothetical protein